MHEQQYFLLLFFCPLSLVCRRLYLTAGGSHKFNAERGWYLVNMIVANERNERRLTLSKCYGKKLRCSPH